MRAKLTDLPKHPSWVGGWWLDLPGRSTHWWKWLLFEPGQGWLRWGWDERANYGYLGEPEPYQVCPPLHRLYGALKWNIVTSPWLALRGEIAWRETRGGFSEIKFYRDPDRKRGT